jgi:hypothetical protein
MEEEVNPYMETLCTILLIPILLIGIGFAVGILDIYWVILSCILGFFVGCGTACIDYYYGNF